MAPIPAAELRRSPGVSRCPVGIPAAKGVRGYSLNPGGKVGCTEPLFGCALWTWEAVPRPKMNWLSRSEDSRSPKVHYPGGLC
jgi:hypothetical protein